MFENYFENSKNQQMARSLLSMRVVGLYKQEFKSLHLRHLESPGTRINSGFLGFLLLKKLENF